jgi:hypothetical protein
VAPGTGSINTTDVLAIQRHFLGVVIIPTGCRLSAADANVNGSINTQDVIATQRFFLAFTSGIGSVGQYKFTPSSRSYSSIGSPQLGQDYAMYVVGDVAAAFVNRPAGNMADGVLEWGSNGEMQEWHAIPLSKTTTQRSKSEEGRFPNRPGEVESR